MIGIKGGTGLMSVPVRSEISRTEPRSARNCFTKLFCSDTDRSTGTDHFLVSADLNERPKMLFERLASSSDPASEEGNRTILLLVSWAVT